MAALQSRGGAAYHHRHHYQYDDEVESAAGQVESSTLPTSRRERHQQQHATASSSSASLGLTLNDEAWVLFAPKPCNDNADRTAARDNTLEEPADPFEQEEGNNNNNNNNDNEEDTSASWQHVHPSTSSTASLQRPHHAAIDIPRSGGGGHATEQDTASGRTDSLRREGGAGEEQGNSNGSTSPVNSNSNSNSDDDHHNDARWSAVPRPRRDTSFFFDDEDEDEDHPLDGGDSELIDDNDDDDRKLQQQKQHKQEDTTILLQGTRSSATGSSHSFARRIHAHNKQQHLQPGSQDGGDTDMLSLPSSLSVSDRSASSDLASPGMFDYPEQQSNSPASISQAVMYDVDGDDATHHERLLNTSTNTLTEAALSRMTSNTTAIPHSSDGTDEAVNTSGSEDEAGEGNELDADEALLSRAPDAISAGIRAVRRRPLQAIRPPSQGAASGSVVSSSGNKMTVSSSSCRSATKRRHRRAGVSDKGSKRSNNTSAAAAGASVRSASQAPASQISAGRLRDEQQQYHEATSRPYITPHANTASRRTSTLAQMSRNIFALDEEVLNMMAQPGSVFNQARPSPVYGARRSSSERRSAATHGFSAFSAHIGSELGETHGIRSMFGCYDPSDDMEEDDNDSGDETETERDYQHHANHRFQRFVQAARRHRRRSSLFSDHLHHQQQQQSQHLPYSAFITRHEHTMAASADLMHTQSLGLHRSFSLASLQHFLVDSVYNSLSSSMLGTPTSSVVNRTPAASLSSSSTAAAAASPVAHSFPFNGAGSETASLSSTNRKRTTSAPYALYSGGVASNERSHSSDDLFATSSHGVAANHLHAHAHAVPSADASKQEGASFRETVSYWRRVLRSFAF